MKKKLYIPFNHCWPKIMQLPLPKCPFLKWLVYHSLYSTFIPFIRVLSCFNNTPDVHCVGKEEKGVILFVTYFRKEETENEGGRLKYIVVVKIGEEVNKVNFSIHESNQTFRIIFRLSHILSVPHPLVSLKWEGQGVNWCIRISHNCNFYKLFRHFEKSDKWEI